MKKTRLALLLLAAVAGSASAQNVTIAGRLNSQIGKTIASADKQVFDIANSLLYFYGAEKLDNNLTAIFGFEHRFFSNDGTDASTGKATFWNGYSYVGLRHTDYGVLQIGRYYTAAFMGIQDRLDPWSGDTVAGLRGAALTPYAYYAQHAALMGAGFPIVKARNAQQIYWSSRAYGDVRPGFDLKFSIAATPTSTPASPATDRPWSASVGYRTDALFVGIGIEDAQGPKDQLITAGGTYQFANVLFAAGTSQGKDNADRKYKGYLLGATVSVSDASKVLVGYGTSKLGSTKLYNKFSLGYKYALSKRTSLYADFARDTVPNTQKTGYDLGIAHYF